MKVSSFFYKEIFVESMDVKFEDNKFLTPFFDMNLDDFSVNNKKLKPNTAYDEKLNEHNLEEILEKKSDKFLFYKIESKLIEKLTFDSTFNNIDKAISAFEKFSSNSIHSMIFNELYINALKHGNFNIDFKQKQKEIEKRRYDKLLKQLEKLYKHKKIEVEIRKYKSYLIIKITNEGGTFDIKNLNLITKFSGRGINLSIKHAKKLFYALHQNSMTFTIKEEQ